MTLVDIVPRVLVHSVHFVRTPYKRTVTRGSDVAPYVEFCSRIFEIRLKFNLMLPRVTLIAHYYSRFNKYEVYSEKKHQIKVKYVVGLLINSW